MITFLIVLGSILTYLLIGHLIWRVGLKIAWSWASDMVWSTQLLWPITFWMVLVESDVDWHKPFQKILDKNDPSIKREKKRAEENKVKMLYADIVDKEIDLGMRDKDDRYMDINGESTYIHEKCYLRY